MSDSIYLDQDWQARITLVLESSIHVRNASGFYLWTQGALQTLIPHEILICCLESGTGQCPTWYSSCRYFREEHFAATTHPETGIVGSLVRDWSDSQRPRFMLPGAVDAATEERLKMLELKNLVAHGVHGYGVSRNAFFVFGRTSMKDTARNRLLLDLVVPIVFTTYCRARAGEQAGRQLPQRQASKVTDREAEILRWIREGKTTGVIAEGLDLSPFTVRNHVKNIFRKLGASSRSQAVANAISLGILQHGE